MPGAGGKLVGIFTPRWDRLICTGVACDMAIDVFVMAGMQL
jgi:hypothetical protein